MSKRRTKRTSPKRRKKIEKISEDFKILYETKSGFSLEITPLPPYYIDIIDDLYSLLEYPARKIELAAGDVVDDPYTPPEEKPDLDDEDYGLWLKWHEVDKKNDEIAKRRSRARRDLLMSVCIEIGKGPVNIDDESWIDTLEAPFVDAGYKVPENKGQRKLLFLKYVVIRDVLEAEEIMRTTMYKEASIEGVGHALKGFQGNMGRDPNREDTSGDEGEDSG